MKCKKCENIQRDPITGMMICSTCGTVYEESNIIEAIEFDDNQNAEGTFFDTSKPNYGYKGGRNTLSQIIDPSQLRLNKVYKYMNQVSKILTIPNNVFERAKKLYSIATNKKFTQGRKTKQIVGAVLYLACRLDTTKHLLIDFSEVLQINLFIIGSLYLKLSKILGIHTKIIDPSLYMHRFCSKFNFGNKSKEVEKTALKVLQFMKRDWITTGRRPQGLCGACILISAKLHKLNININNLSEILHICNETIKKRIEEFSLTKVANMSMEEFQNFNEKHFYPGADPPAFLRSVENSKNLKEDEKNDKIFVKNDDDVFLKPKSVNNDFNKKNYDEEKLSMIPDNEEYKYIYSKNEYDVRKQFWEIMHKDWIEEQNEKEKREQKMKPVQPRKRLKKVLVNPDGRKKTAFEAIKSSKRFGKKINYNYVRTMISNK